MYGLNELMHRLVANRVEFVVVGGFAAIMHGSTLTTRDVDICCRFTAENLFRIQVAVADLHPVHRMNPNLPLQLTAELCATLKNLYLKTDLGVLDCLGEVKGLGDYEAILPLSVTAELPFGECRVLGLDALIRAKEAMGRDHDKITVNQLLEIKKKRG